MKREIWHALSEVRKNCTSLNWWRNRVFVPYVIGTATRFHPKYPGYDDAVRVMEDDWDTLIVLDACRADTFQKVVDLSRYDQYSTRVSRGVIQASGLDETSVDNSSMTPSMSRRTLIHP